MQTQMFVLCQNPLKDNVNTLIQTKYLYLICIILESNIYNLFFNKIIY